SLAKELLSDMGKGLNPLTPLPVLDINDVRARLTRMLNISPQELDLCKNLYMLQGRPRWSAAVIREIPKVLQAQEDPQYIPKHEILDEAISTQVLEWTETAVSRLEQKLAESDKLKSYGKAYEGGDKLEALLLKLFIVYSLFDK